MFDAVCDFSQQLVDGLLELVYPTRCVVCERPGDVLCDDDLKRLSYIDHKSACRNCGAPFGVRLCTECMTRSGPERFAFDESLSVLHHTESTESIVLAYKNGNERRLAEKLAALMTQALPLEWRLWADAVAWIPADRVARQRRGFDHMQLLAGQLADMLGLPALDLLVKHARTDQRALSRAKRRENAARLFGLRSVAVSAGIPPGNILLIDDVFTTGATLDTAALVLREAGVRNIRALTIARVW